MIIDPAVNRFGPLFDLITAQALQIVRECVFHSFCSLKPDLGVALFVDCYRSQYASEIVLRALRCLITSLPSWQFDFHMNTETRLGYRAAPTRTLKLVFVIDPAVRSAEDSPLAEGWSRPPDGLPHVAFGF